MRVRGSVVVVTGASSGIGRATALALARKRARAVVLVARGRPALDDVAREVRKAGAEPLVAVADVAEAAAVEDVARRVVERFGRIDAWVNAAAVASYGSVEEVPLEHVRRVLDVDVVGALNGVRAALPAMRRQGEGVVVNLASIAGITPMAYSGAYSMAKAAVLALGGTLRGELLVEDQRGIAVVSVIPTTVDTPFFDNAANVTGRAVHPMPPVNSPERVADAVVKAIRKPRAEVFVGGGARSLAVTARTRPERAERLMARQIEALHLREEAPTTDGILWTPTPRERADLHGGSGGRTRTALRRVIGVGALAGAVVLVRRAARPSVDSRR